MCQSLTSGLGHVSGSQQCSSRGGLAHGSMGRAGHGPGLGLQFGDINGAPDGPGLRNFNSFG